MGVWVGRENTSVSSAGRGLSATRDVRRESRNIVPVNAFRNHLVQMLREAVSPPASSVASRGIRALRCGRTENIPAERSARPLHLNRLPRKLGRNSSSLTEVSSIRRFVAQGIGIGKAASLRRTTESAIVLSTKNGGEWCSNAMDTLVSIAGKRAVIYTPTTSSRLLFTLSCDSTQTMDGRSVNSVITKRIHSGVKP